ncbi:MAG: hypothetical protein ABIJ05_02465 [Patescibacteria group bacterium]
MKNLFDYFDDYIVRDIDSMYNLSQKNASTDGLGRCGFQLVMTLCTFCEILGALEMGKIDKDHGNEKFKYFVINHLHKKYHPYKKVIYDYARHGIAHGFITPPGLMVLLSGDEETHLGKFEDYFVFDVFCFKDDVLSSYEKIKKKYNSDKEYKKQMDSSYRTFLTFLSKWKTSMEGVVNSTKPKEITFNKNHGDDGMAVPSGAYMDDKDFEKLSDDLEIDMGITITPLSGASGCHETPEFTRLPDDILERINSKIKNKTTASGIKNS